MAADALQGTDLRWLAERVGTPFYVYDAALVQARIEAIAALFGLNEAITLGDVEPLYRSDSHCGLLKYWMQPREFVRSDEQSGRDGMVRSERPEGQAGR